MSMDNTMGITNTEFCPHGQHMVKTDQITWVITKNGRRRICQGCKDQISNHNKGMKNAQKLVAKPAQ